MAKKQPAKPEQEFRAGNAEHVNIPAKHIDRIDDDGEVRLSDSGLDHIRALKNEAAIAKARGELELATGLRRDLAAYAATNTVAQRYAVYIDSVASGVINATKFGTIGGPVTPPAIPPEHQSRPVSAKEVMVAIGEKKSSPSEWIKTSGIPYTMLPNRSYVVDTRYVPRLKQA